MSYFFEQVRPTEEQIKILYELLKTRNYVISHKNLPSFDKHRLFVNNHPYRDWFLISDESNYFGSFYLKKDNSVGINLIENSKKNLKACIDFISDNFTPAESVPSMVPNFFYINISYSNKEALGALQELGLNPIQISLRMEKNDSQSNFNR